jgi:hypothetical protein
MNPRCVSIMTVAPFFVLALQGKRCVAAETGRACEEADLVIVKGYGAHRNRKLAATTVAS